MNPQFDGAAVEIPDGRTASFADMRRYGQVIQQFVRDTEARLPLTADTLEHNRIVDFLHALADAYNQQLRIFRESEQQRVQRCRRSTRGAAPIRALKRRAGGTNRFAHADR